MKLVVISGVSGSGKSTALHVLEDLDYYCIDNLPVGLLPAFAEQVQSPPNETMSYTAVGIDARNLPAELHRFPYILEQLKNKGVVVEIIFIDTDDNILLKRFSETRRKHPLTEQEIPLIEAIKKERELLDPIAARADLIIDTSLTNIYQLRDLVKQRISGSTSQSLSLLFESFGFKHGLPSDADYVFDIRCLPNPHWEASLRDLTGLDQPVIDFLDEQPAVTEMYDHIQQFMQTWIPRFESENRSYLTVAIGCTGGQHRSVYLAHELAETFKAIRDNVSVRHRDLK
ncbi:MAG: RNase adapter RapZ [Gammaproteobacteria bacterium]|nr:RNase adapter RapZ [Gammaproteobacteria bacterium]